MEGDCSTMGLGKRWSGARVDPQNCHQLEEYNQAFMSLMK